MTENIKLPKDLRILSEIIGKNSMMIQGPGGNTSFKSNNQMWIKGSGTMLSDALKKDIFVLVDCNKVLSQINNTHKDNDCDPMIGSQKTLRPSIETSFHALIPYSYVVHTHSINVIVHGISPQGRLSLEKKLKGFNWLSVPYKKPGEPLTREIQKYIINGSLNDNEGLVIILYNHGLIIAGQNINIVEDLLKKVEECLQLEPLKKKTDNKKLPSLPKNWEWLTDYQELSKNPKTRNIINNIVLYPDHVVFLGDNIPKISFNDLVENFEPPNGSKIILIEEFGVILNSQSSKAVRAMAKCLSDVLLRLPNEWSVEGLSQNSIKELIDWDAEKFRQKMNKEI